MKEIKLSLLIIFTSLFSFGQTTFSWSGYSPNTSYTPFTAIAYPYTLSGSGYTDYTKTTITSSAGTSIFKNSTPKYSTSTDPAGFSCSSAPNGLYVSVDWTNASSNVTIVISFDGGVNGVCGPLTFSLYDINDDGFGSWNDAVDVSAISNTGAALTVSKTNDCNASASSGTTVTFKANSSSSCTCWGNNNVSIGTSTTVIRKLTLKYYSTTTPTSYNVSPQYIVVSNISTGGFGCAAIILPVELQDFKGKCEGKSKTFNWTCISEQNNDHFSLEHSIDGINFEEVATIKGNGDSKTASNYEFTLDGDNPEYKYYRLLQTDANGNRAHLKTIYLNCEETFDQFELFPNPSNDILNIQYEASEEELLNIDICDFTGNIIKTITQKADLGSNLSKINVNDLESGLYNVKLYPPNGHQTAKVLKFVKI